MTVKALILAFCVAGAATQAAAAPIPLRCTAMADATDGRRLVHEGRCNVRVTAASTFKIALSLMGYDSGYLVDEHTPLLPFQQGYTDWNPAWRSATAPTSWMNDSVVWYSQKLTTKLGHVRFQRYVNGFKYGNRDLSGTSHGNDGLTRAWLNASLKVSPLEQVDFLTKVVNRKLPVKAKAYEMTQRLLKRETLPNGWEIYGKTGTGHPLLGDGKSDYAHSYGWYVGWASKGQRTIVFARLAQDQKEEAGNAGQRVTEAFLRELPARLDAL
ncbi:class D beta-lactamase [Massilia glaciei]|uniref:Beta-lactamase n=1 Tax=Massilia glaciei TaxID=1524097 RepID=A0A2U2HEQ2_9BURK|nr:class D beta-lactamase [Massilia glaciei]PWF42096.1 class D beta-lactamase [Massilia glaciei]